MKKTSLLKLAGAVLIVAGTFFTPLTSITRARQACIPEGGQCSPTSAPCCAPNVCWKAKCRDAV